MVYSIYSGPLKAILKNRLARSPSGTSHIRLRLLRPPPRHPPWRAPRPWAPLEACRTCHVSQTGGHPTQEPWL